MAVERAVWITAGIAEQGMYVEWLPWLVRGLLWLAILTACVLVVRRRLRKWRQGEYCDCCDGSCGNCKNSEEKSFAKTGKAER